MTRAKAIAERERQRLNAAGLPRTASERAADATKARVQAGGRVLRVILTPEARRALDRLTGGKPRLMSATVERLLLAASPPDVAVDPAGFIAAAQKSRQG